MRHMFRAGRWIALDAFTTKQNADGGWPYVRGVSWTEPTTYGVLALLTAREDEAAQKGIRWLQKQQRPDGGWPPLAGVAASSWVTALAALLPPELLGATAYRRAIDWLVDLTGQETTWNFRLRSWLVGRRAPAQEAHAGWPWGPGSAAWVAPTAHAVLALGKASRRSESARIRERVQSGREFLLSRTCEEGGWNHGGVADLRSPAHPYPETTGLALTALRGIQAPEVRRGIAAAKALLEECRSADGVHWLRLGLAAHGELSPHYQPPSHAICRTLPDLSLQVLADAAVAGHCVLWE